MADRTILVERATGLITPVDDPEHIVAIRQSGNPLAGDWRPALEPYAKRIVVWSGNMGDDLFASHPATWLAPGHQALHALCDVLAPMLEERGCTLCFHPHRRHVLSDPHACAAFLKARAGGPFEIALAPHAFIEASMLDDVEDHFARSFQILGGRCAMVFASDLRAGAEGVETVPLGEGRVQADMYRRFVGDFVPAEVPLVIRDEDSVDRQRAWLGDT